MSKVLPFEVIMFIGTFFLHLWKYIVIVKRPINCGISLKCHHKIMSHSPVILHHMVYTSAEILPGTLH